MKQNTVNMQSDIYNMIASVESVKIPGRKPWEIKTPEDKANLALLVVASFENLESSENSPGFIAYRGYDPVTGHEQWGLNAKGKDYFKKEIEPVLAHKFRTGATSLTSLAKKGQVVAKPRYNGAAVFIEDTHLRPSLIAQNTLSDLGSFDTNIIKDEELVGSRKVPIFSGTQSPEDSYRFVKRPVYNKP